MNLDRSRLRAIVLDCPALQMGNQEAMNALLDILRLRFNAYGSEYVGFPLPTDAADFAGTHVVLVLDEPDRQPKLISAFRSVSWERCSYFHLPFVDEPGLLKASGAHDLISTLEGYKYRPQDIAYTSGWATASEYRGNLYVRELISGLNLALHRQRRQHFVAALVHRFKGDRWLRMLGADAIGGTVKNDRLGGEQGTYMLMTEPSSLGCELLERAQPLLEQATYIGAGVPSHQRARQAAMHRDDAFATNATVRYA